MTTKIFLSYAVKDSKLFDIPLIVNRLSNKVIDSEIYYCERDSKGDWVDYMNNQIENCDFFILFCSPNAQLSEYVKLE